MMRIVLLALLLVGVVLPLHAQEGEILPDNVFPPPHYATEETFALVAVPRLNVRNYPSTELGSVIGLVRLGERYQILGWNEDESWLFLQIGAGQGWVYAPLVLIANPDGIPSDEAPPPLVTAIGNVELRFLPGEGSFILFRAPAGAQLTVLSRNYYGTWLFVEYDRVRAWVNLLDVALPEGFNLYALPVR